MYKVSNGSETLLEISKEEYEILVDKIDIFREEGKIVIPDEYCGNKEYSIKGIKTLLRIIKLETIEDVEELIYCLILVSAFDPNFEDEERRHIKYESYRHGLYHICCNIYRDKDIIMTEEIQLNANDIDVGFESWMLYNIDIMFYFKDMLLYKIGKRLFLYNLISNTKKILISGKSIDCDYKISFYILNGEIYIHIYYDEDVMGGVVYKIQTNMEMVKVDILSIKWLIYLYNIGETVCYNGRFMDLYRKYDVGEALCELSHKKRKKGDMRKLLYYNFPDEITRKVWGCKNVDVNIYSIDKEATHFESYIDEMTDGTVKKGSVINILINMGNGEIIREACDLPNYANYSPYHKYFLNNEQLCTIYTRDSKLYIKIYQYI